MTNILTIGSLNIDLVYQVAHFVSPGETLPVTAFTRGPGGKGLNQSIAAARAGASVRHVGCIGEDGLFLRDLLVAEGVDVSMLRVGTEATGHAIIQVSPQGENSILIYPGANHSLSPSDLNRAFDRCEPGDLLMLQNEVNETASIIRRATQRGLRIIFNTAPFSADILTLPLEDVSVLICNESEGQGLTGQRHPGAILATLNNRYPRTDILLTLGAEGCRGLGPAGAWHHAALRVTPVDTTAAGDTFVGYLAAGLAGGLCLQNAVEHATRAAAITVTRPGAAMSIPRRAEIL